MKKIIRGCLIAFSVVLVALVSLIGVCVFTERLNSIATPVTLDGYGGMAQAGLITEIATSHELPGVMLAGASNLGGSVIYSLDSGIHWHSVPSLPWTSHYAPSFVAITLGEKPGEARLNVTGSAPAYPSPHQVFTLIAGEKEWLKFNFPACPEGYNNDYFSGLSVSPADPQRVYVIRYCDNVDYSMHPVHRPFHQISEIYSSSDGGRTFQRVYFSYLEQDKKPENIIYAMADFPNDFPTLVLPSPVYPEQVYLNPTMVSNDGGQNWSATNFPVDNLVLDGVDPERLYGVRKKGGRAAIGMTRMSQATGWKEWAVQPCEQILQLVAHPTRAGTLFIRCGSDQYLRFYHGQSTEELLISEDSGASWKHLSEWSGNWIGPDYGVPGRMLWARNDGLWATTDLGEHWTQLTIDYQTHPEQRAWDNVTPPGTLSYIQLAAVSTNDLWVGDYSGELLHWDGQMWSRIPLPQNRQVSAYDGQASIYDLAFVNSDNGWMAAGESFNRPDDHLGIVYHWDGKSWRQTSPEYGNLLKSISAIKNHAWAVGENGLIVHWDGKVWTEMDSPVRLVNPQFDSPVVDLYSISMVSAEEGWAVGGPHLGLGRSYILHYQNGAWQIEYVSGPNESRIDTLAMVSSNLGWAGGGCAQSSKGVFLRWDGKSWQDEQNVNKQVCFLSASLPQNAWAEALSGNSRNILHWDGNSWKTIERDERLLLSYALAILPDGNAWFSTIARPAYYDFLLHSKLTD